MERKKNPDLLCEVLADMEANQDNRKKLDRYASAKKHSNSVSAYILKYHPELIKIHRQINDCGEWMIFRFFYTVNIKRMIAGCTCKIALLCSLCALRRAAKLVQQFEQKMTCLMTENPDLVPVLITITVKNSNDLLERYNHLCMNFSKLLQKYLLLL